MQLDTCKAYYKRDATNDKQSSLTMLKRMTMEMSYTAIAHADSIQLCISDSEAALQSLSSFNKDEKSINDESLQSLHAKRWESLKKNETQQSTCSGMRLGCGI